MLAFLFRRLGQGLLVVAVMATLVFVGVYALGNPIDILISPEADQLEREQAIARLGLDRPLWVQFGLFVKSALTGDLGISFVHGVPAIDLILSRMPATLELALVALVISVGIGIPRGLMAGLAPRSLARPRHHGRLDPRLLGAELLARPDADPAVRGRAEGPAGRRTRRDRDVLGIQLVAADARRPAPPDPAGAHARIYKASLVVAARLRGHPRGACCRISCASPAPRACRQRRIVGVHVLKNDADPGRHRARPRARLDDRLRGRDRDRVRLARHGQAADRIDLSSRSSGHRRLPRSWSS